MPIRIKPRKNGIFYLRGTVQGKRFDQSAHTRDRAEAQAIADKLGAEAFTRAVFGDRAVATFMEAVEAYLQAGGDETHMKALLLEFGTKKLSDITQATVDRYAKKREGAAPATLVRQVYTPLQAVMNFAASSAGGRLCDRPEFRKPTVKNGRTDYLKPAEAEAWLKVLPPYLGSLFTFYLATGCRASEALELEWKDVSPDRERVVFWETKGGYPRGVDLIQRARDALPDRVEGHVFRNSRGEPWHGYDAINLMFRRHQERHPKLPPVHCHLLRHTWATWNYAATRDLTFLMGTGGWRSVTMVMRYTHAASDDLARAAAALKWTDIGRATPPRKSKGPQPQ